MNADMIKLLKLLLPIALIALSSCVRDEVPQCPDLKVTVEVKDKNYANIDDVEMLERVPEDLPFRSYVPTLYYILCDAESGEVVEQDGVFDVEGDEKNYTINFCSCLPHGHYTLTIWGGLDDNSPVDGDGNPHTLDFHPGNAEGLDVYVAMLDIVYDADNYEYTAQMERTKGKLLIECSGYEPGFVSSEKSIDHLRAKVDHSLAYDGRTHVVSNHFIDTPVAPMMTATALSPSTSADASILHLQLGDGNKTFNPHDVKICIHRNELTVLRYIYNPDAHSFKVLVLVNAAWKELVELEI